MAALRWCIRSAHRTPLIDKLIEGLLKFAKPLGASAAGRMDGTGTGARLNRPARRSRLGGRADLRLTGERRIRGNRHARVREVALDRPPSSFSAGR